MMTSVCRDGCRYLTLVETVFLLICNVNPWLPDPRSVAIFQLYNCQLDYKPQIILGLYLYQYHVSL